LSRRDRSTTLAAALLVPAVSISLSLAGLRRTVWWLEQTARHGPGEPAATVVRESEAALVRVRRRAPWAGRCLARALSLWWILRRQGVFAELHIGVRTFDGKFEAHAWVVLDGRILADSAAVGQQFPGTFRSAAGSLSFGDEAAGRD
jgi:hypothetical protein